MRLSGLAIAALAAALVAAAGWQRTRREQQQLRAALAAAEQRRAAAEADRRAAQTELAAQLRALEALRRQVRTPAQIAQALPAAAHLPAPVHLEPAPTPPTGAPVPEPPRLVVPAEDIAPLWNFVADCGADRLRLEACQRQLDAADRTAAALRTERDAALRAARGRFWQRVGRAAKWMAIGAALGALAARH
jgi:type II secretory pathway pseudopilin PulG